MIASRKIFAVLRLFGSKHESFKNQCDASTVKPNSSCMVSKRAFRNSDSILSRLQNTALRNPLSKSMENRRWHTLGADGAKRASFFDASKYFVTNANDSVSRSFSTSSESVKPSRENLSTSSAGVSGRWSNFLTMFFGQQKSPAERIPGASHGTCRTIWYRDTIRNLPVCQIFLTFRQTGAFRTKRRYRYWILNERKIREKYAVPNLRLLFDADDSRCGCGNLFVILQKFFPKFSPRPAYGAISITFMVETGVASYPLAGPFCQVGLRLRKTVCPSYDAICIW